MLFAVCAQRGEKNIYQEGREPNSLFRHNGGGASRPVCDVIDYVSIVRMQF